MKKIFVLLLACFMQNIRADELSDAIRASDVEKVKLLLQNKPVNKSFTKYLDTAEQVIRLRRDNITAQDVRPCWNHNDFWPRKCDQLFIASIIGFSCSLTSLPFLDGYCFSEKWIYAAGAGSVISFVGMFAFIIVGEEVKGSSRRMLSKYLSKLHNDAITIKEMLYDHLDATAITYR